MMLVTTSAVRRFGRFCFSASLICTHSVRKMSPPSKPTSYFAARNPAIRDALSSSTICSTRSM